MGKHRSRDRSRSRSRSRDRHRKHKKEKKHKSDRHRDADLPRSIPYSDVNNPFNDSNLMETFVWDKKLKMEGNEGMSKKAIERMNRQKIYNNIEEMEKLKRERDARQAAKEDIEFLARQDEKHQNADWRRVESSFHLNQAEMRSKIRIKENRAKPIDFLLRYARYGEPLEGNSRDQYEDFELEQPTKYIKNLSVADFEDLLEDIKVAQMITKGKFGDFWNDITTLIRFELDKIKKERDEENIHSEVMPELLASFEKKTFEELKKLEKEINGRIKGPSRGIDVSFWEEALYLLRPKMARTRLKELHPKKMKMKLEQLRAEQKKATEKHEKDQNIAMPSTSSKSIKSEPDIDIKPQLDTSLNKEDIDELEAYDMSRPLPFTLADLENLDDEQKEEKWLQLNEVQLKRFVTENYNVGGYSPKYLDESKAMPGIDILKEDEDAKRLKNMRSNKNASSEAATSANEARMMQIAQMGMNKDEASFSVEENLGQQDLLWSDKFRPQKPKYFNRVHTGFDWNKYNQTHYDMDNPPPKIVQGYRFNIFYPDLLDPTNTPHFKLYESGDDPDFAILKFMSGAPYEDIAFKIVNREWDTNHKSGYKCQFNNGVFQLWFFFRRMRYRR